MKGPKYSSVKARPRAELTAMARDFTLAVVAAAGVDSDAVEASSMQNDEQWEIGGATQHEDGTWSYDVMCCVQTWVMDLFAQVPSFTATTVVSGDDVAVDPCSIANTLAAHEARLRFWEHTGRWSIVWNDCDHTAYTAFNMRIGNPTTCNVAMRYGARTT